MKNRKKAKKRNSAAAPAAALPKRSYVKPILIAAGAVIAVVLTVIGIWYAMQPKLPQIKLENGKYADKTNGVSYLAADINYEPVAVGEPYAEYGKTTLYIIDGLDPKQYLTEKYEGIGAIYYADTLTLPGLSGWAADSIIICESDEITIQKGEINDAGEIAKIVDAATAAETVSGPAGSRAVYHLKFTSSIYSGLYFDLLYLDDGTHSYFYDRTTKDYHDAGDLLLKYLPRKNA